ncbi:MAG TPA: hypothetical protein VMT71_02765 [Syntrophorhabdales bacterium]|nr:hypothetical protein [Syntrophorhabdales bacterium]
MDTTGMYLCGIGQLADKLAKEIAAVPYEKFAEDTEKIESVLVRLAIMKEGWTWLPGEIQQELTAIDWSAVAGKWDWQSRKHVDIDVRQLWETIMWKLPEMSRKVGELLRRQE